MSEPRDPNTDPGDGSIELTTVLPEGSIPIASAEVVIYLHPESGRSHYVRWQGTDDMITLLGMIELAKLHLPNPNISQEFP